MKKSIRYYAAFLSLIFLLLICMTACGKKKTSENAPNGQAGAEATTEEAGIQFPYELDNGKFIVQSLFQSDIDNPDNGNQYADGIASLEVTNQSGKFCKQLELTVVMLDGEEITFIANDIPDGKTIWMFEKNNKIIDIEEKCKKIKGKATMGKSQMMEDKISWSAEETNVTLQNISSEELTGVVIDCHCLFDGETYFGGTTYEYEVGDIPSGQSVQIDAQDCYLGSAEVVRIEQK